MKTYGLLIFVMMLLTLPLIAQRRKAAPPQLSPEEQEQLAKLERMTANTQRVVFIDSIVISKQQLLQTYQLAPEVGRIMHYQDFRKGNQPHAYGHVNELGNRCYLSQEANDSTINLYQCEVTDDGWSQPQPLQGINDEGRFRRVNYPFMMGDGMTFYFAADGDEGLGGYDIYVTRYDTDESHFLRPANIGMPFNSEANDYLYVIDEYTNIGWFATDRRQHEDSVCVYTFIPSPTRETYSALRFTPEEIARYARIDRIADTWTDEAMRQSAMQRLHELVERKNVKSVTNDFQFVINDDIIYSRLSDFKAEGNQQRYQQLTALQQHYKRLSSTLDQSRDNYATATQKERDRLCHELLAQEQQQQALSLDIRRLEKSIRNNENKFLTKNI